MISKLFIKNYLLIEELSLDFNPGFSVITGETGAGKSIIIGAISLLLGKRADTDVLENKNTKCIVEGTFTINDTNSLLRKLFNETDLDFDTNTIIRREIIPSGKSRAFINDTPVNLGILKKISENIISLHTQQENLALSVADYRMQIIDTTAKTKDILYNYQIAFSQLKGTKHKIEQAKEELSKAKQDIDYYSFQAKQLQDADLIENDELESLEEQSKILENAEEIRTILSNSINNIDNDNISITSLLRELKLGLNKLSGKYKQTENLCKRIESIIIELNDIDNTLQTDIERAETNPELLETINNRIDLINSLLLKHNSKNIDELKNKLDKYLGYVKGTEEIEENILILEKKLAIHEKNCENLALELSKNRQKVFTKTEKYISDQLKQLGMPDASFKIQNNLSKVLCDNGIDNINFLFSANKSGSLQILEKVASGGEFSRLMLTLKSLLINASDISSIIFDEIDTGVSGEIANKMGKIMKSLSSNIQVISITHLPQVAALGNYHLKVYKDSTNQKTISKIKQLDKNQRIHEIASMISGDKLTKEAIENAKILLQY